MSLVIILAEEVGKMLEILWPSKFEMKMRVSALLAHRLSLDGIFRARNTFSSALLPGDEDAEIYTDLNARKGHVAGEER